MILREKYPGGRQPSSVFWAIVQPAAARIQHEDRVFSPRSP